MACYLWWISGLSVPGVEYVEEVLDMLGSGGGEILFMAGDSDFCMLGDGQFSGDVPFLLKLASEVGEICEAVRGGQKVVGGADEACATVTGFDVESARFGLEVGPTEADERGVAVGLATVASIRGSFWPCRFGNASRMSE